MDGSGIEHAFCWFLDHAKGNDAFYVTYRWFHYLSAGAYVGLLAFLNLILLSPTRGRGWGIGRELLKAVFWLWRWSAMLFLFTGLNLLHMLYNFPTGNYFEGDKGLWMAWGASLGLLSWALAWFLVGPAQARHFKAWPEAGPDPEPLAPRARLGLRLQTLMLPPLVMGMAVGGHGMTLFSWGWRDVALTLLVGSGSVLALYAWARRRSRVRP
jgi:hypothetical protein